MSAGLAFDPADLVRLFQRAPMGAPQTFTGTSGLVQPAVQPEEEAAAVPGLAGRLVPLPPQRPDDLSVPSEADVPARGAVPAMGQMTPPAPAAPAPSAAAAVVPVAGAPAPAATAPAASGQDGPSFGDRLLTGLRNNGDYLGALGAGLLSAPTWAGGVSAGMQLASKSDKERTATDLAKVELGLKQRKLAQETGALAGNAAIIKRAYPSLTDAEASAAGQNSAMVAEALKIQRDPNHGTGVPAGYRLGADGRSYEPIPGGEADPASIRARAQATAEGSAAGKPDETYTALTEDERVAQGLPAGSYQKDSKGKISPINPNGTTINMGAEKAQDATVGKGYGEYQLDLANKGRNAASTLNTLALMEQAARNPNFYSGVGAEQVKRANQFLVALGVKDANFTKPTEIFNALSNKVVLDGLGGSLGPSISNTDRDYIGRTAPTLEQSQQGNLELVSIARSLAQRQQQVAKLARDYAGANGGRLDTGFDQVLEDFASANPLFPAANASATQQSDGKTGASGPGGFAAPKTQAEFDALPKGAVYVDPNDGKRYRK
ncbi:hypothetical protein [Methylobacterium organophilum]|uniref:Uncharacterized protein n=1 Tax=Methylobacterium organophilum TaxID=410 RepID=A0ABQ4TH73_METOR|nr:hypothetical protein [Methylobacterium organophilum]GJE29811.1 hypothetical protein LKMONMHP_4697 [Methylobacterium organophilum]